jgi:hypothetical protein
MGFVEPRSKTACRPRAGTEQLYAATNDVRSGTGVRHRRRLAHVVLPSCCGRRHRDRVIMEGLTPVFTRCQRTCPSEAEGAVLCLRTGSGWGAGNTESVDSKKPWHSAGAGGSRCVADHQRRVIADRIRRGLGKRMLPTQA